MAAQIVLVLFLLYLLNTLTEVSQIPDKAVTFNQKTNGMKLKLLSKWLVVTGTLSIWAIKFGIRPISTAGQPVRFILGIAPNLLGAFLLPFGAFWLAERYLFPTRSMLDVKMQAVVFFCLLVINEYLQLLPLFGRTFDMYDIIFSAAGLLISYSLFGRLYQKYLVVAL